ncbi:TetR/AcrR family transcriptional regulator C-terminal domain-containing protein [Paenibacillus sp. JCM 10914]|uniref:TetR/AcrR family transcriptional regulator n=1 Tax=Paenibacillus sp. JCM 10914 TaxID=1236974 RepID=UPI0003CCA9F8|nr:TetR/AcrR family transcriptional regulator [Paenibacillus sp. JCM 10914]GAE08038.1 transcriptional regulator, TetR family [Paenibacillus sp. JCM 10914]
MNNSKRTIVSRRARPAKDPLSHEEIIKTAYSLIKEEGMSGMTMRKIAKALDTGPSSLYVYVKNVQELNAYVMDYALGQLQLPPYDEGSWKTRLFGALDAYFKLLHAQPGLAELSLTTLSVGTNSFRLIEYILTALHEAGISSRSAAWGVDLFLFYVSSVVFEKSTWEMHGTTHLTSIKDTFMSLDPAQFPMIAAMNHEMFSGDTGSRERFHWGLEVILQGLLQMKHESSMGEP